MGPVLALVVLVVARTLPESPRWLLTHGRVQEAEQELAKIEEVARRSGQQLGLVDEGAALTLVPEQKYGYLNFLRLVFRQYPKRAILGASLMITQSFLYNANFFTYALVLTTFYGVSATKVPIYGLAFSVGNLAGPLLLAPLFDSVGRKKMISGTYLVSGTLLAVSAWLFDNGDLTANSQTFVWVVIFFFASAGASAAYLTVSETWPIEIRSEAIAVFFTSHSPPPTSSARPHDAEDMDVSTDDFAALFAAVSTWGRWGETDQRGALHHLTPAHVVAAAGLVRAGRTISLSFPLNTLAAAHNPHPAAHHMTMLPGRDADPGSMRFAKDYVGFDYHSDTHSHIDALCHVAFHGSLYNRQPCERVTSEGATVGSIEVLQDGLVGRGVLLDIPRLRGVSWLEPGEQIFAEELEAAEQDQGVTVGQGDILLVRTGHARRLAEFGPWETAGAKAGLHPTAMPFVAERRVAALGSDGNSDTAPSTTEGVAFPIHVLAINAMGVHLLDYLQLEDLRLVCEASGRWEFLFLSAPLRIVGGTGSPVNPIAIL